MASKSSIPKLPLLDLPPPIFETDNTRPSFTKEISTVGDLISFNKTALGKKSPTKTSRRRERRKSGSDVGDEKISGRVKELRRSESVKGVGRRRSVASHLLYDRQLSNKSTDADDEDEPPSTNRSQRRRNSFMSALRTDLVNIPRLNAWQRRTSIDANNDVTENVFGDSDTDDENATPLKRRLSRLSSYRSDSRRSVSSSEFHQGILSETELRKLRMLHSLSKMDGRTHNSKYDRRTSRDNECGELAVLEASYLKRKRGSIATHVLVKTRNRKAGQGEVSHNKAGASIGADSPTKDRRDSDVQAEELKERTQKIFQMLQKTADKPKLAGIVGKEPLVQEGGANNTLMNFRRRLRKKRFKPLQVFRKRAKFLVLLLRAWKIHSNNINESLVDNNKSLDMITRGNQPDLMFDVTTFKAAKEATISPEVKRILSKPPKHRTDDEQYYVQIFLRNYKSIAEYPVKMQKLIAQRSWIESYDIKRVIVREGHVPMCFYFILSGSAVVSAMENGVPKTIMFLGRGDSFGDLAILNSARRETTVISREKIELLCMTDEDFVDIFMSGGMQDPDDPFLKSLSFLDGWPKAKLIDNPKKCIFSYFKRGTVLVQDTTSTDWIFVIKSGSASVLKKLEAVDISKKPKKKKVLDFREKVLETLLHESSLSHEDQITLMCEEEKRGLEDQNLHVRFYALPEINVKTNESYNELKQMKEEYINASSVNRALGALEKLADSGADMRSETAGSGSVTNASDRKSHSLRRRSLVQVVLKGPFKTAAGLGREQSFASITSHRGLESRGTLSRNSRRSNENRERLTEEDEQETRLRAEAMEKVDDWQELSLPSLATSPVNDLTVKPVETLPIFVEIQNLTKGQVFGLAEMLYDNQPTFSLVSNGAEVIMVEKKFYLENASQRLMVNLRESTYPYPSAEALQSSLEAQMHWDHHKQHNLNKLVRELRLKRSDPHDARSTLQLPVLAN